MITFDLFNQPDYTIPFNKNGGQKNINENRLHFSGQALVVLNTLLSGESVSSEWGIAQNPRIYDVRARVFALKSKGIQISEDKIEGGKGAKKWYCTPEQILVNKNLLKSFLP